MHVEVGATIEFTYTDKQGTTRVWSGKVTTAEVDKPWFRLATGDAFPRTFRYDRVQGEMRELVDA